MTLLSLIEHSFPKGPKIAAYFLLTENKQLKVTLKEHDQFTAYFSSELSLAIYNQLLSWCEAYSEKGNPLFFPFPESNLPLFTLKVLQTLQKVPFGKTCSYQELAIDSQSPKAFRAVGTICRLNSFPLLIPCHRVVLKNGSLGEFAFGASLKKELLQFEGAL